TMSTEEKINQAKGTVKEGFGKLTGDKKTEKEGAAEKVVSKVKEVAEDAKDAVEGAIEGVKNMIKGDDK
ncbi:CsbD family protein, partial [Klebsiella pneumoniae]